MESFASGGMGNGAASGDTFNPSFRPTEETGYPVPEAHYTEAQPIMTAQHLEEGQLVTVAHGVETGQSSSPRSFSSSVASGQEAGYPGPEVHHAVVQSMVPPQEERSVPGARVEYQHARQRSQSRSGAFDKDWI
jgi:hypothetical protein